MLRGRCYGKPCIETLPDSGTKEPRHRFEHVNLQGASTEARACYLFSPDSLSNAREIDSASTALADSSCPRTPGPGLESGRIRRWIRARRAIRYGRCLVVYLVGCQNKSSPDPRPARLPVWCSVRFQSVSHVRRGQLVDSYVVHEGCLLRVSTVGAGQPCFTVF